MKRAGGWAARSVALLGLLSAIGGCSSSKATSCETGTERCPCYRNNTCNTGLACYSSMCVAGPVADGGGLADGALVPDVSVASGGSGGSSSGPDGAAALNGGAGGAGGSPPPGSGGLAQGSGGLAQGTGGLAQGSGGLAQGTGGSGAAGAGSGGIVVVAGSGGTTLGTGASLDAGVGGKPGTGGVSNPGSGGIVVGTDGGPGTGGAGGTTVVGLDASLPVVGRDVSLTPGTFIIGVTMIEGGGATTCALLRDGTVWCWGANGSGTVGDGTGIDRPAATPVTGLSGPGIAPVATIEVGHGGQACALLADKTLRCWGSNQYGQLGDGTSTNRMAPTPVPGLGDVLAVAGGGRHTCALLADHTVSCWGANDYGQLGDGTWTDHLTPAPVKELRDAVAVGAGYQHSCALLADGTARCWGRNTADELGDGKTGTDSANVPIVVAKLAGGGSLSVGGDFACVLSSASSGSASSMVCWGNNVVGELASGNTYGQVLPHTISLGNVMGMGTGHQHACAVLADRTVHCWGSNAFDQLGDLSESYYTSLAMSPVQIGINDIVALTSGFGHNCALRINGTVACWGAGESGQLGNGGATNSKTPVAVIAGP